jgi:hypothetical protein
MSEMRGKGSTPIAAAAADATAEEEPRTCGTRGGDERAAMDASACFDWMCNETAMSSWGRGGEDRDLRAKIQSCNKARKWNEQDLGLMSENGEKDSKLTFM